MEKLNRRALRVIFNNYTSNYNDLLEKAGCTSLYMSRINSTALETYRSINKINPPFLHDLFLTCESNYSMRRGHQIMQPKVHTEKYGINSFRYEGAKIWNNLPNDVKSVESVSDFKNAVKQFYKHCECNMCTM